MVGDVDSLQVLQLHFKTMLNGTRTLAMESFAFYRRSTVNQLCCVCTQLLFVTMIISLPGHTDNFAVPSTGFVSTQACWYGYNSFGKG